MGILGTCLRGSYMVFLNSTPHKLYKFSNPTKPTSALEFLLKVGTWKSARIHHIPSLATLVLRKVKSCAGDQLLDTRAG